MSEAALQKQVIDYLRLVLPQEVLFHHSPNEGKRGWNAQRAIKAGGTRKGWPDIEIICAGRAYFVELKSDKGRVSPEQDACHASIVNAGGNVTVARSLQHVIDALERWQIPTRASLPARKAAPSQALSHAEGAR